MSVYRLPLLGVSELLLFLHSVQGPLCASDTHHAQDPSELQLRDSVTV